MMTDSSDAELANRVREVLEGTPGENVPYLDDAVAAVVAEWRKLQAQGDGWANEAARARSGLKAAWRARDEWKATAETQGARAEEARVKCETAYRKGYEAGHLASARARSEADGRLRAAQQLIEDLAAVGRQLLLGPDGHKQPAPRVVLASNPLDTWTPDYH